MSLLLVFNEHRSAPSFTGESSYRERTWTARFLGEERKYMRKYRGKGSRADEEETGNMAKDEQEGPLLCKVHLSNVF